MIDGRGGRCRTREAGCVFGRGGFGWAGWAVIGSYCNSSYIGWGAVGRGFGAGRATRVRGAVRVRGVAVFALGRGCWVLGLAVRVLLPML